MQGEHPADRLIREVIATRRRATPEEVAVIVARMATAPFDGRMVSVRMVERGIRYRGHTLGAREDSLRYHLIKRVEIEEQWSDGATIHSYLADLRRSVLAPTARLLVYERRGGAIAATITPTDDVLERSRRGSRSLPNLLVVYSVDWGKVISGYQFSTLSSTGLPEEVVWLK